MCGECNAIRNVAAGVDLKRMLPVPEMVKDAQYVEGSLGIFGFSGYQKVCETTFLDGA